jgi:thiamine-phosphate pyrophosphorylase
MSSPAPERPVLCYVTDRHSLKSSDPRRALLEKITQAIAAGVDRIQIREKGLPSRDLLEIVREAVVLAKSHTTSQAIIFVNDRLDIAIASGCAGVHLGRESAPLPEVVRWCRAGNASANFEVGVSCHSLEEALEAEKAGASYIFFGPVFDSPAKRQYGAPQGLAAFETICHTLEIPVIAIGGVDEKNASECLQAGAAGIAAIRFFQESATEVLTSAVSRLHALAEKRSFKR